MNFDWTRFFGSLLFKGCSLTYILQQADGKTKRYCVAFLGYPIVLHSASILVSAYEMLYYCGEGVR